MKRRTFLEVTGLSAVTTAVHAAKSKKPNILVIMTDQQFADAMSCVIGTKYMHTPAMDALADNGVRFTRAYSPNPLCMPMRASFVTGKYPHQTGVQSNSRKGYDLTKHTIMGTAFKNAGYETAYFGKWHVNIKDKDHDIHGFETFVGGDASLNPGSIAEFLRQKHDRPFFAVASFLGPHEICQWARKEDVPGDQLGEVPPMAERPPLRTNSAPPANETEIMAYMRKSYHASKMFPVGAYTEVDWRRHIWGYHRLIERVDGYIGTAMEALRKSGAEKNTVVLFLSDHGDCHGAHKWNQKTVFYDESARVPFIISWKGTTPKGTNDVLINTGIDSMPTLCDFAGIEPPAGLPGKSLKDAAMGRKLTWNREYIICHNHMVQGSEVDGKKLEPHGRMVRSDRYKYCAYSIGEYSESLVDMKNDPGELTNLARIDKYKSALEQHRTYLAEWCKKHGDDFTIPRT